MKRVFIAALMLGGCAWGPGGGFATVEPGTLTFKLDLPPTRLDAAGRWKTDNGYILQVSQLSVWVFNPTLTGAGTAGSAPSGGAFDPANPPAGYSLCHNGHCHRADGALVSYADIEAEMARGTAAAAPQALVRFSLPGVAQTVPVPGTATVAMVGCSPDCLLELGAIEAASLPLAQLVATGTVAAGAGLPPLGPEPRPFSVAHNLGPLTLSGPVTTTVSRQGPARYTFTGELTISEKLFDGIDWTDYAASGPIALESDPFTQETLTANMAKSRWQPHLTP